MDQAGAIQFGQPLKIKSIALLKDRAKGHGAIQIDHRLMRIGGGSHTHGRIQMRGGTERIARCKKNLALKAVWPGARILGAFCIAAQINNGCQPDLADQSQIIRRRVAMLPRPEKLAQCHMATVVRPIPPIIPKIVDALGWEKSAQHGVECPFSLGWPLIEISAESKCQNKRRHQLDRSDR